jgi:hypothetical protein
MDEVDGLLLKYEPGEPKMKPDVLKQIDEILEQRRKELEKEEAKNLKIVLQRPGEAPIEIGPTQAVEIIKSQQQEIAKRDARIDELEKIIQKLLSQSSLPSTLPSSLPPPIPIISNTNPINKGEPVFKISDFKSLNF